LDGIHAPEIIPPAWDAVHVGKRLSEAFEVLARMPSTRGPGGFETCWPKYTVEWQDQLAQAAMEASERDRAHKQQNRVVVRPSSFEIQHMEAAISWPARYLDDIPQLLRVVGCVAVMKSRDCNMEDAARRLRLPGRLARRWNNEALGLIANGLICAKERIF
jgi:hypothetical protein